MKRCNRSIGKAGRLYAKLLSFKALKLLFFSKRKSILRSFNNWLANFLFSDAGTVFYAYCLFFLHWTFPHSGCSHADFPLCDEPLCYRKCRWVILAGDSCRLARFHVLPTRTLLQSTRNYIKKKFATSPRYLQNFKLSPHLPKKFLTYRTCSWICLQDIFEHSLNFLLKSSQFCWTIERSSPNHQLSKISEKKWFLIFFNEDPETLNLSQFYP